jgi:ABC-type multidrug transport system ATPase subunit
MSLQLTQLSKTYPNGVKAINNLSLEINKGMFGLLGPNGAGKSSLMRTIATLQTPDTGSILFEGLDILKNPMALRKQLGYLPQEFGVYPKVSALKLLDYFATLKGISSKKERDTLVQEALEITNLYEVRKKHVSAYSGGMKQRFGIAQLLLNTPKLIIVDEPTAGLDPAERVRFLNILRAVGTNNTVIFSTHIVEDVKDLCTDMAIVNKGELLQHRPPSEAIKSLEGCLWTTRVKPGTQESFETKFMVLSSNYTENNLIELRVHSETKPNDLFSPTQAKLEDVYFLALQSH